MNIMQWRFTKQIGSKLGALFERWRRPKKAVVPMIPNIRVADPVRRTKTVRHGKAYADQRQKAKRNRRRKPKKSMVNLYHL